MRKQDAVDIVDGMAEDLLFAIQAHLNWREDVMDGGGFMSREDMVIRIEELLDKGVERFRENKKLPEDRHYAGEENDGK